MTLIRLIRTDLMRENLSPSAFDRFRRKRITMREKRPSPVALHSRVAGKAALSVLIGFLDQCWEATAEDAEDAEEEREC